MDSLNVPLPTIQLTGTLTVDPSTCDDITSIWSNSWHQGVSICTLTERDNVVNLSLVLFLFPVILPRG